MMTNQKDDEENVKNWSAPLSFHFSRPANDNRSPLHKRLIGWGLAVIGLGSIVLLLVL